jgi:hypothetical protein
VFVTSCNIYIYLVRRKCAVIVGSEGCPEGLLGPFLRVFDARAREGWWPALGGGVYGGSGTRPHLRGGVVRLVLRVSACCLFGATALSDNFVRRLVQVTT